MGSYLKTVASATYDVVSAVVSAAKVIGPATVEATRDTIQKGKETVVKINEWSDETNAKLAKAGIGVSAPVDASEGAAVGKSAPIPDAMESAATEPVAAPVASAADFAYPLAMMALLNYVAVCDEEVSPEEEALMQAALNHFCATPGTPESVKQQLRDLYARTDLRFKEVEALFDQVSDEDLADLPKTFEAAAAADGVVTPEEELVQGKLAAYLERRAQA